MNPTQLIQSAITSLGFPTNDAFQLNQRSGVITSTTQSRFAQSNDLAISSGFSGGQVFVSTEELTGVDERFVVGINSQGFTGSDRSNLTLLTEEDVRDFAAHVAATGVPTDDLPRYLFVGSTIASRPIPQIDGTRLRDVIVGGTFSETLRGGEASDEILGGDDDDTLIGDGFQSDRDLGGKQRKRLNVLYRIVAI